MMQIVDFSAAHIEQAVNLAKQNYEEERRQVSALPEIDIWPDYRPLWENQLGVAALEGGKLVGFLCSYGVWDNAWNMQGLRHVYSPMGANGAAGAHRGKIYARLYQTAADKWKAAGATSHGVCLYAHDGEGESQFHRYGFGGRTVDAIRFIGNTGDEPIPNIDDEYTTPELTEAEISHILPLENRMKQGFADSPAFMTKLPSSEEEFMQNYHQCQSIYTIAKYKDHIIAFIRAEKDGETFVSHTKGYIHINGAYCLPEHRDKGVSQALLHLMIQKLRKKGYTHLGVDYESINPPAYGFWGKYFHAYTQGVVRRVDN